MKRFAIALALVLMFATTAFAGKVYTISITQIVEHPALDAMRKGFQDQLKKLGIEAKYNVHIAQGNMGTAIQIANQIKGERPDLIMAIATPTAQAVVQKIKDIPIVISGVTDPVGAGLVKSLANPGGNVTGMTDMSPMHKHLALIQEAVPGLKTLGVIYNAGEPNSVTLINLLKRYAKKAGIKIEEANAANSAAVYQAAKSLVGRSDAVYVPVDNTVVSALETLVKVCRQNKLPLFAGDTDSVARGAIAALAVSYYDMGVQTADMAAKVIAGTKPADLPVEYINKLSLHVNLKAAKSMGLTLPQGMINRADKVIR